MERRIWRRRGRGEEHEKEGWTGGCGEEEEAEEDKALTYQCLTLRGSPPAHQQQRLDELR
eukprot:469460-Pyramimonas_sp.AAC.1